MEDPMTEARALTPPIHPFLSFTLFLLSFPHHHHHPCLAASGISFLGGIGIALCFCFIAASTSSPYSHLTPRVFTSSSFHPMCTNAHAQVHCKNLWT